MQTNINYTNFPLQNFYVHTNNEILHDITFRAEQFDPRKFKFKTGQLIKLLLENPGGLSKIELSFFFCQNFDSASFTRRESLRMSIEKLIQRARVRFNKFHLTINYNKNTKKYSLSVFHQVDRI